MTFLTIGTSGHGRTLAITFSLQIGPMTCVANARACTRVLRLMYPSRTRGVLSVYRTSNPRATIIPTTEYVWGLAGRCMTVISDVQAGLAHERRKSDSQELMASAISCTKLVVASKGAAWPAPSIRCVVAVGMAAASDRTSRNMLSGLRAP
jgi:hypothetical protein